MQIFGSGRAKEHNGTAQLPSNFTTLLEAGHDVDAIIKQHSLDSSRDNFVHFPDIIVVNDDGLNILIDIAEIGFLHVLLGKFGTGGFGHKDAQLDLLLVPLCKLRRHIGIDGRFQLAALKSFGQNLGSIWYQNDNVTVFFFC